MRTPEDPTRDPASEARDDHASEPRATPETDAATLNKWQDSCPLQVVPKSLAVALERQRDELLEALEAFLGRARMGEVNKGMFVRIEELEGLSAAIAAVKGGNQ